MRKSWIVHIRPFYGVDYAGYFFILSFTNTAVESVRRAHRQTDTQICAEAQHYKEPVFLMCITWTTYTFMLFWMMTFFYLRNKETPTDHSYILSYSLSFCTTDSFLSRKQGKEEKRRRRRNIWLTEFHSYKSLQNNCIASKVCKTNVFFLRVKYEKHWTSWLKYHRNFSKT